ncbi:uncharacterized protein N7459_006250 [Penicillium hispanicum]|uniref:uncharacterized protein n=1 Tax=Penicillium hispanicum TaxID=1080232 RepID=UPI0025417F7C|nr:uncharacterized protein N7459_006250 [Penicillium hispanicum]KAJ5580265.1 hypothetical protein N7459_006250 [Penicillium hispanicum]
MQAELVYQQFQPSFDARCHSEGADIGRGDEDMRQHWNRSFGRARDDQIQRGGECGIGWRRVDRSDLGDGEIGREPAHRGLVVVKDGRVQRRVAGGISIVDGRGTRGIEPVEEAKAAGNILVAPSSAMPGSVAGRGLDDGAEIDATAHHPVRCLRRAHLAHLELDVGDCSEGRGHSVIGSVHECITPIAQGLEQIRPGETGPYGDDGIAENPSGIDAARCQRPWIATTQGSQQRQDLQATCPQGDIRESISMLIEHQTRCKDPTIKQRCHTMLTVIHDRLSQRIWRVGGPSRRARTTGIAVLIGEHSCAVVKTTEVSFQHCNGACRRQKGSDLARQSRIQTGERSCVRRRRDQMVEEETHRPVVQSSPGGQSHG